MYFHLLDSTAVSESDFRASIIFVFSSKNARVSELRKYISLTAHHLINWLYLCLAISTCPTNSVLMTVSSKFWDKNLWFISPALMKYTMLRVKSTNVFRHCNSNASQPSPTQKPVPHLRILSNRRQVKKLDSQRPPH